MNENQPYWVYDPNFCEELVLTSHSPSDAAYRNAHQYSRDVIKTAPRRHLRAAIIFADHDEDTGPDSI